MKAFLSSALLLILFLTTANPVFAESPTFKLQQDKFFLQTSSFGKTLDENINVQNLTESKQTLLVSFEGYKLPENQLLNQTYLTKHTIDFALLPQKQIEIESLGSSTIPITFNPPSTYPAGDYFGTLIIANENETKTVNFTIRMLGQLKESGNIESISNSGDFLVYKITNTGTVTSSFFLKSTLSSFLGQEKSLSSNQEIIRPGEIREIKIKHGQLWPGFYQSQTSLIYGQKATQTTKLFSFWVQGEFFVISLLTLIISLLLFFVFRRRQT